MLRCLLVNDRKLQPSSLSVHGVTAVLNFAELLLLVVLYVEICRHRIGLLESRASRAILHAILTVA